VDLSIIIVNFHHSHMLGDCLESINRTIQKTHFETILVDNSNKDKGLEAILKLYPKTLLINNLKNVGFARANNQGAKIANGDFLLFINPDTTLTEGAVESMLNYIRSDPSIGILGPKVLNPDQTIQYSCRKFPTVWSGLFNRYSLTTRFFPNNRYSRDYLMLDYDHNTIRSVDWVSGCCMMAPNSTFKKANGFDENYFLFIEDVDLCQIIKKKGLRVVYFPDAKIFHKISSSNSRLTSQLIIKRHKGMIYYNQKHTQTNLVIQSIINAIIMIRCLVQILLNTVK
jgi:N-acetylglucosaminyl-diphospho-decaprenol L-rhamnosyltransferase